MQTRIQDSSRMEIIRIVAVYSLFGSLWIYLSDTLLGLVIQDPVVISRISMYKGLLFIALTTTLLYVLIARYIKRINEHIDKLSLAQQLLDRQKTFLNIAIEGTTDAVYIKDVKGRYLLANSAVSKFVKKPAVEIIGQDDTHLFPAEEAHNLMLKDQWVMKQAAPQTYEEHLTTPDGERYFLSTKGAMLGNDGTVDGLFGIARDITERKKIETELQIATISINSIADAVYWVVADGKIWRVNNAACQMLGYSEDELCSLSIPEVDPTFPQSHWAEHWLDLKRSGSIKLESTHRMKDGRDIPVEISANFIVFEGKEFNCATVREISERRVAEAALKQEQLFAKKVIESLPGIFYLYTYPDLRLVLWNKNHETLLGFNAEEMKNRDLYDWHAPEAIEAIRLAIEAVMDRGQSEAEAPLMAKD